jgi:hypothetical protein
MYKSIILIGVIVSMFNISHTKASEDMDVPQATCEKLVAVIDLIKARRAGIWNPTLDKTENDRIDLLIEDSEAVNNMYSKYPNCSRDLYPLVEEINISLMKLTI